MRLPIGSTSVSASGGNATLIGRRGEGWERICDDDMSIDEAIALLEDAGHGSAHEDPAFDHAVRSERAGAPRFAPDDSILWRYGRHIEAVRVVRDDPRGLVIWIPSGSARLEPVPADGRRHRDVPLDERFTTPWVMAEKAWTGPGVVRVAPAGRPWSVWFFRRPDGTPDGAYVNLELPHRRVAGDSPAVYSRDLVLDIWIDAEHAGSEDIWLKDADELDAVVAQGRFSGAQAAAVRCLGEYAVREFIADGGWPLDEGWAQWQPDRAADVPVLLPSTPAVDAARRRSGSTSLEG
ncbi:DUF402 domain-containing protein [Microbacterium sp. Bi121]|uniref:DUF402 domain-containing protein n=1 Tax=Microbacterium sp. Bi121 TaxID=2822348 RepID=UPI001DD86A11|nr:DUF402 domain-containing protein [Microbacterium sp. Bi121]CAH0175084.1 hypothetical protein SRABI121_01850 [Microbacterium sp. Bi121]